MVTMLITCSNRLVFELNFSPPIRYRMLRHVFFLTLFWKSLGFLVGLLVPKVVSRNNSCAAKHSGGYTHIHTGHTAVPPTSQPLPILTGDRNLPGLWQNSSWPLHSAHMVTIVIITLDIMWHPCSTLSLTELLPAPQVPPFCTNHLSLHIHCPRAFVNH